MQKWLDEIRELIALGQTDLPAGYKISGLKRIATDKIEEQLPSKETSMTQKGMEVEDMARIKGLRIKHIEV